MAYASYQTFNPAQESSFFSHLTADSQFLYSKIRKKNSLLSRKKKASLTLRSMLPAIADFWATLSTAEKDAWTTVGSYFGHNGWRSFVLEQSQRLKFGYALANNPSIYHLGKIGHISVVSPAIQIELAQEHPSSYYIRQKVPGIKGLYAPVQISEPMGLPISLSINYKSSLSAVAGSPYIKFYVRVRSSYQGIDRFTDCVIDLSASSDWTTATASISSVPGYIIGYTIYFHVYGYNGDLYFDRLVVSHGGVNWVRDKFCSNIKASFSNQYYQIPKNWVALVLPTGAEYNSDYIDF